MQTHSQISTYLWQLEHELRLPSISPELFELSLADDFVEFASSGEIYDKAKALSDLTDWSYIQTAMSNRKEIFISDDSVLLTYEALTSDYSPEAGSKHNHKCSLRSSLWQLQDGRWRMRFHQGTPLSAS